MKDPSKGCVCGNYGHLELSLDNVTNRVKESKSILCTVERQAKWKDGQHSLLVCKTCGQFWQQSPAYDYDYKTYLFKVPATETAEWVNEPFLSPSAIVSYEYRLDLYFRRTQLIESEKPCQEANCAARALEGNVLCELHFIKSLQKAGLLPRPPKGKRFEPYTTVHIKYDD